MPTNGEPACDALVDTSVAVPLVVVDHEAHPATLEQLEGRVLGLAGHAWFEAHSVLTRLPGPARRRPLQVAQLLVHNFPGTRFLSGSDHRWLAARLAELDVAGGGVYDGLVAAVARRHELPLVTRDRRALPVYRAFEVQVEVFG
jgi:predicted nucleic acid-binding protein